MQARKFPAAQGWLWFKAGFRLWRQAPLPLTAACIAVLMALLLAMTIPGLGQFLPALLLLPLGVGLFLICAEVAAARPASPALLLQGFRRRLSGQIMIGSLRVLSQLLCFWLAGLIVGIDPAAPLASLSADGKTMTLSPHLQSFMFWGLALSLPLEMLFWFAAPLVALAGLPPVKALFFSLIACWRNLAAIVVCHVSWLTLFGFLPSLLFGLFPALLPLLAAPLVLLMMPVFYAAFYASAGDIFGADLAR